MVKVHLWILVLISSGGLLAWEATADAKYTAMYVFGDSLLDPGNNIYFVDSIAKANHPPYGVDFSGGPTGRFCNGKTIVDFIAEILGLPLSPSYANTVVKGTDILSGVNYASAGAGILDDTGKNFGRIVPLSEQISNFKKTVARLRKGMQEEEVSDYLGRAIAFMEFGSNDYLNNYLLPSLYPSSRLYTPQQFTDLLINHYKEYILELRGLGIKKFIILQGSPIGCAPLRVSKGECDSVSNSMLKMFNSGLRSLVRGLTSDYPGSAFMALDSFQFFYHVLDNAEAYGFKVRDRACCGGYVKGGTKPLCYKDSALCSDRDEYMFWDAAHPTEATNRIIARLVYNTTSWP